MPLDGSGYTGALESDPGNPAHVFRWSLVRQYDDEGSPPPAGAASPSPVNVIVYRYENVGGMTYLTDVFDTPPAASPTTAALAQFAHHTRLVYETRPDQTLSFRRGWRVDQTLRLVGVDVAAVSFLGGSTTRHQVRRYHLAYDPKYHASLLTSIQLEGRCAGTDPSSGGGESAAPAEDPSSQSLPATTSCPGLPPMTLDYQHVMPFHVDGSAGTADLPGYEGFDERPTFMAQSPPNSIDENMTDLFDVNSDGLPDVVVTTPGQDDKFPFYLSGAGGARDTFGALRLGVIGVLGATATGINLANDNVQVSDMDGDGTIDWLHQPMPKSYAIYTPQLVGTDWFMAGRAVAAAAQQDPRLDLGEDTPDIDLLDANGDGLIDVVRATGTEMQTFFSLGRYPGGDGNFGSAAWTGPASASLSLQFVSSCVPLVAPGVPVRFSDSTIRLGDMNGDGLQDIVYVQQGDIRYWPGRGDGSWGTGPLGACSNGFAPDTFITMNDAPQYSDPNGSGLRIDDVNGDGLDDLVQVRFDAVDVWLNVDGTGFTPQRHVIQNVQPAQGPLWAGKVRLVDVNGSGTRDILWGEGGSYRYMDLAGGQRPSVLTHIDNGLGKTTDLTFSTSTAQMLAAEAAGHPWSSKAPTPVVVVSRVMVKDNLPMAGSAGGVYVTEYTYRDAVYDGRQREFRGFRSVDERHDGDTNSPSSTTSNEFLLGDCADDEPPPPGLASRCVPAGRWADNPREALKGLLVVRESVDDGGTYLSTEHHQYTLRKLYTGLDGRQVRAAFESQGDRYLYDVAGFKPAAASPGIADVVLDQVAGPEPSTPAPLTERASSGTAHTQNATSVDVFGNVTADTSRGCVDGAACASPDDVIAKVTAPEVVPGDVSGWLWRTSESYVQGGDSVRRRDTTFTYDVNGHPTKTTEQLSGSLPLDRFHESSGTTTGTAGNTAPNASVDAAITVSVDVYDGFGNRTGDAAPNGRCHETVYASDYADFVISETVHAGLAGGGGTCSAGGGPAGPVTLTATAAYDRGLGALTNLIDLHQEPSLVAYDGLGRLVAMTKPSASSAVLSALPSIAVDYDLATPARPYSIVHTRSIVGATESSNTYRETFAYIDGLGRRVVTIAQADPNAGDAAPWIAGGLTNYDAKQAPERSYLAAFYGGDPRAYPLAAAPTAPFTRQSYDAFGRELRKFGLDGTVSLLLVRHALATDHWDAADLEVGGPHEGTPATETLDGHGRTVIVTERLHATGGGIEAHDVRTAYLSTGEPAVIARVRVGGGSPQVVRWLRYDTLGRMVLNVEPNATKNFNADPTTDPSTMKTLRYAYDDNGDLVGTSDARGCGENYLYDTAGRIVAEDYSPCLKAQVLYSSPTLATGAGTEVFYQYDQVDSSIASIPNFSIDPTMLKGRLVAMSDRGAKTVTRYDGRGRATGMARRLVAPGTPTDDPATRYAPHWYVHAISFDAADRQAGATTGVDPDVTQLLDANGQSVTSTTYSLRDAVASVSSGYGALIQGITRDADGLLAQLTYADAAKTTTAFSYDGRRRLSSLQTYRGPPAIWTSPPSTYAPAPAPNASPSTSFQLLLADVDYRYDVADNPTEIDDWRNAAEWPTGAKPGTRKIQYDDLYRATQLTYEYAGGTDGWVSPFDAEDRNLNSDPRRGIPEPHVSFPTRVLQQTFQYDWLGNTLQTDDDSHGFYDRSIGTITNGAAGGGQPYQIRAAAGAGGARTGSLSSTYDDAGNLVDLSVTRAGVCLPSGANCSQRFAYDWDELGRLVQARRWDLAAPGQAGTALPTGTASADLVYAYDGNDNRTLKTAIDANKNTVYDGYVFDSLELRRTQWTGTDYVRTAMTEVAYLFAHGVRLARLHYDTAAPAVAPSSSASVHVLLELEDYMGSSSMAIDAATSELVERDTYMAYGQADSDYRPARWNGFREDYRFTGKEEDIEVGLQYFGKRFLNPMLGRWMSPDPASLHEPGSADMNLYAYVHGQLLRAIDPIGLGLWQALKESVATGSFGASSPIAQALVHGDYAGSSILQNDKTLQKIQNTAAVVTVAAASVATGGLAEAAIASAGVAGSGTAASAIAASAVGGGAAGGATGIVQRAGGNLIAGKSMRESLKAGFDPRAVGKDVAIGAAFGAVTGAAMRAYKAVKAGGQAACVGGCGIPKIGCFVAGTLVATPDGAVPIEVVALGDAVLPDAPDCHAQDPDLTVRVDLLSSDAHGNPLELALLRSPSWVDAHELRVGDWTFLELPEMDTQGWARVLNLEKVAPPRGPPGCPVTGLFRRLSEDLVTVRLQKGHELISTWGHRLLSESRGQWVAAGDLQTGEVLSTPGGSIAVDSVDRTSHGRQPVYNLEVGDVHRYLVGDAAVVAHNTECGEAAKAVAGAKKPLVIGETMTRVQAYANKVGADVYPGMPGFEEGMEAEGLAHNRAFIEEAKAQGRKIVDIGPDFEKRAIRGKPSDNYEMERKVTKDYAGYQKAFERSGNTTTVTGH
ncbi:MAG TPA: toxin TcdB middle/N-terminal domain-containing protein [Polyangiaceae bacterium]|nr:toxin TcdB middle/N-terminal domain-containing protein [Polyangiaceae bacterium]